MNIEMESTNLPTQQPEQSGFLSRKMRRQENNDHWLHFQTVNAGNLLENTKDKIDQYVAAQSNHRYLSEEQANALRRSLEMRTSKLRTLHEGLAIRDQIQHIPDADRISLVQLDSLAGNLVSLRRQLLKKAAKDNIGIEAVNTVLNNTAQATMRILTQENQTESQSETIPPLPQDERKQTSAIAKKAIQQYVVNEAEGKNRGAKELLLQKAKKQLEAQTNPVPEIEQPKPFDFEVNTLRDKPDNFEITQISPRTINNDIINHVKQGLNARIPVEELLKNEPNVWNWLKKWFRSGFREPLPGNPNEQFKQPKKNNMLELRQRAIEKAQEAKTEIQKNTNSAPETTQVIEKKIDDLFAKRMNKREFLLKTAAYTTGGTLVAYSAKDYIRKGIRGALNRLKKFLYENSLEGENMRAFEKIIRDAADEQEIAALNPLEYSNPKEETTPFSYFHFGDMDLNTSTPNDIHSLENKDKISYIFPSKNIYIKGLHMMPNYTPNGTEKNKFDRFNDLANYPSEAILYPGTQKGNIYSINHSQGRGKDHIPNPADQFRAWSTDELNNTPGFIITKRNGVTTIRAVIIKDCQQIPYQEFEEAHKISEDQNIPMQLDLPASPMDTLTSVICDGKLLKEEAKYETRRLIPMRYVDLSPEQLEQAIKLSGITFD